MLATSKLMVFLGKGLIILHECIKHCVPDCVKITHLKRITLAYGHRNLLCLNEQFILKGAISQGYCCFRSLLC